MKKTVSTMLIISIVMCLTMAFPASAAKYIEGIHDKVLSNIADCDAFFESKVGSSVFSEFKYKFVGTTRNYYASYNYHVNFIMYSNTEYLQTGSIVYFFTVNGNSGISNSVLAGPRMFHDFVSSSPKNDNANMKYYGNTEGTGSLYTEIVQSQLTDVSTCYYVGDFSTISALGDNFFVKTLPVVNMSVLESLLSQAESLTYSDYRVSTLIPLYSAIESAENLLSASGYTQEQIDAQATALQSALNGLELLPDATELKELLVEADEIEDVGYTQPTWVSFATSRTSAHTLINGLDYTSPQLSTSYNALSYSMINLEVSSSPVVPPPYVPKNDYSGIITGNVLPFIEPSYDLFRANVFVVLPLVIGLFGIIMSIRVVTLIFKKIFK